MELKSTTGDTAALLLLALAAAGLSGCVGAASTVDEVTFSADGSKVAFVQDDTLGIGFTAEAAYMKRVEYIRWAATDRPLLLHRVKVSQSQSTAGAAGWTFDAVRELRFSPDSRHIAARTDTRILALDTSARTLRPISRPAAGRKGMAWSGADELVWWEEAMAEAGGRRTAHLTVYRRKLADGSPPTTVHHESSPLDESERHMFYQASFSPNGRQLIFSRTWRGRTKLLTLAAGKVRYVGPAGMQLDAVSWKPDGSAALCQLTPQAASAATAPAGAGRPQAWLIELASAAVLRAVPEFSQAREPLHVLGPRWTADGQYVLADDGAALSLIRPRPWKVVRLRDKALVEQSVLALKGDSVGPLPAAGWVWGRRGASVYAIDYRQQHRIRLSKKHAWAVSPGGRRIAEVDRFGNLRIRKLSLPTLRISRVRRPMPGSSP